MSGADGLRGTARVTEDSGPGEPGEPIPQEDALDLPRTPPISGTPPCALLDRIRNEFARCCACDCGRGGSKQEVSPEALACYWRLGAESSKNPFTSAEKQALALGVVRLVQEMDLRGLGAVSSEEWVHYWLALRAGKTLRESALPAVNETLRGVLRKSSNTLADLQRSFELADIGRRGVLSLADVEAAYRRRFWRFRPDDSSSRALSDQELEGKEREVARQIIEAMDLDGDGCISYLEFVAFLLGRRKHDVNLHLYDLSKGMAQAVGPLLFGRELDGVWHTGTVVYGREYHYARDTVHGMPGDTSFGLPTRVVPLGFTLWRKDEFHHFVNCEMKPVFQRDTYDVVCNNCNHFTDCVCMWLTGKHPPEEVMHQPSILMQSAGVRALRPLMNWWLRDRIVVREASALPEARDRAAKQLPNALREQPALASVVEVRLAEDAPSVLGQVVAAPTMGEMTTPCVPWDEWHDSSVQVQVVLGEVPSCACHCCGHGEVPGTVGGCSPFPESWAGACSHFVGRNVTAAPRQQVDGVWVQHFEIVLEQSGACRGQIRTDFVPSTRVSRVSLKEAHGQDVYARAFAALNSTSLRAAEHFNNLQVSLPGVTEKSSAMNWSERSTTPTSTAFGTPQPADCSQIQTVHTPAGNVLTGGLNEELVPSRQPLVPIAI